MIHQAHDTGSLRGQNAHQGRIGHGGQGMVPHPGFRKQLISHEQIAVTDGAPILGEGRAGNGKIRIQCVHQGIGDGADIAFCRRIECGAVFEKILRRAGALQPVQGGQGLFNCFAGGIGAGFQGDDDGIRLRHRVTRTGGAKNCTVRMPWRTNVLAKSVAPV